MLKDFFWLQGDITIRVQLVGYSLELRMYTWVILRAEEVRELGRRSLIAEGKLDMMHLIIDNAS